MQFLRRLFKHSKHERLVCFRVTNYEEVLEHDPEAIEKLERNLARRGVLPAKIDVLSQICCVRITSPTLKPKDVQKMLEKLGFCATLMEDK